MNCPVCEYKDYNGGKCPSCGIDSTSLLRLSEFPSIYYNKAVELIKQERLEEAKEALTTTTELNPEDVDTLILLGKVCAETGDYEKAVLYWDKASRLDANRSEEIKADVEKVETLKKKILITEKPTEEKEDLMEKLRETIREETKKGLTRWTAYAGAILVLVVILGFYLSFRVFLTPLREQQVMEEEKKEVLIPEVKKIIALQGISNILVEEKGGIVYLSGKVPTLWDKQRIEKAVEEVKEIKVTDTRGLEVTYPRGYYYIVKEGESLWIIAERLLGDGNKYNEIYTANNKEIFKDPLKLSKGEKILIPE